MGKAQAYLSELARALSVLALLLFAVMPGASPDTAPTYGQVGVSPAVAVSILAASAAELCGGGWGDQQLGHVPCHACRNNAPALPPAPCAAEPAFLALAAIDYPVPAIRPVPPLGAPRPPSQGPPAA